MRHSLSLLGAYNYFMCLKQNNYEQGTLSQVPLTRPGVTL